MKSLLLSTIIVDSIHPFRIETILPLYDAAIVTMWRYSSRHT